MPTPDLLILVGGRSSRVHAYFKQLERHSRLKIMVLSVFDTLPFSVKGWSLRPVGALNQIAALKAEQYTRHHAWPWIITKLHRRLVRWEAGLLWLLYYAYLRRHPRALIGLWSGVKFRARIVRLVAKTLKRRVVFFENGVLPLTTTVDDKGINYHNSLPRDEQFYLRRLNANTAVRLPTQLQARRPQPGPPQAAIALPPKYLFVPFQVNTDSQIVEHSTWVRDMHHLFAVLQQSDAHIDDQQLHFVIKEHPECPRRYPALHNLARTHKRLLFANFNTTQELIQKARAVVTINSTVGWEALLLKKKVITLGAACYNLAGLVRHVKDEEAFIDAINHLDDWQPDERLRRAFLHYVYQHYCIPDDWRHPTTRHWRALDLRLNKMVANRSWLPGVEA